MAAKNMPPPFDWPNKKLSNQITEDMRYFHIPGVALGILYNDNLFTSCFGVTNVEHPLPVTDDTLFQIGSITKTFTAVVAMQLVEAGQLDLDVPVQTYLPSLRLADNTVANKVTLRHIFSHTGGWAGDYFHDFGNGDDALERIVDKLVDLPQLTTLGEVWSYNNAGFYIAGRILEVISGKTYESLVKETLLDPLGMSHSFYFPGDIMTYRFASGHEAVFKNTPETPKIARPWPIARSGNSVGGLSSTINDLLRYARFHLEGSSSQAGKQLLSRDSIHIMQTPRIPASSNQFMGVSWFIREVDGVRVLRHGGATNGQMATFEFIPQHHFALVILTNSDRGDELYKPLTKQIFNSLLYLDEIDPQAVQVPLETLSQFTGLYDALLDELKIFIQDGSLYLQSIPKGGFPTIDSPAPPPPPPVRLASCGEDRLICLDEPMKNNIAEIIRKPDGKIAWLRISGRIHSRLN